MGRGRGEGMHLMENSTLAGDISRYLMGQNLKRRKRKNGGNVAGKGESG
jgi:hypothetical protein